MPLLQIKRANWWVWEQFRAMTFCRAGGCVADGWMLPALSDAPATLMVVAEPTWLGSGYSLGKSSGHQCHLDMAELLLHGKRDGLYDRATGTAQLLCWT